MLSESPRGAPGLSGPGAAVASAVTARFKYRIRFAKAGDLRLVSHHDLMHCFERMLRRAALPVARTQGFNPRPRVWFALSLALGIVGRREVLELELTEALAAEEVERRLVAQAPPGIAILSARGIDVRAGAHVCRALYRLPLTPPPDDLAARCSGFLDLPHHWIERDRPQRRRFDLRAYVSRLEAQGDALAMALWVTPYGAGRPDEVALALGLDKYLEQGAVFERTDLELEDEGAPQPDPALRLPPEQLKARRPEAAPRPHALVDGPLSFES